MMLNVALIAAGMGKALIDSLKTSGKQLKALAEAEAKKLATSLATVGELLASGEIDLEEAQVLISLQKNASEAVLASVQGISQVAARKATHAALNSVLGTVDDALGIPLIKTLLG